MVVSIQKIASYCIKMMSKPLNNVITRHIKLQGIGKAKETYLYGFFLRYGQANMDMINYVNNKLNEDNRNKHDWSQKKKLETGIEFFFESTLYFFLITLSTYELYKYYQKTIESAKNKEDLVISYEERLDKLTQKAEERIQLKTKFHELAEKLDNTEEILTKYRSIMLLKSTQHIRFKNEIDNLTRECYDFALKIDQMQNN